MEFLSRQTVRLPRWAIFVSPGRIYLTGRHVGDIAAERDGDVPGRGGGPAEMDGDIFRDDDPVQHPRQVAEFPVRPDEADRCPGDGAADQRINDTRQRDFKALAQQVKAQQHQQRNKHRGMGVLHVTEGKKQHAGQDDQQQLPFNRGNQQQDRQADRHPNQRADNP